MPGPRSLLSTALAAVMVTTFSAVSAPALGADARGPARLYSPEASPQGQSWADLFGDYAVWAFSIPVGRNPLVHRGSPRNCEVHGDFVYLGGEGTAEPCTVPGRKSVVLSFAGYECSTAEGNGKTFAELRRCARGRFLRTFNRFVYHFSIELDGRRLDKPRRWTFTAANRVIRLPKRNLWGAPAGPTKSANRALLYVLRPMAPGRHVVHVQGKDWQRGRFDFSYRFRVPR